MSEDPKPGSDAKPKEKLTEKEESKAKSFLAEWKAEQELEKAKVAAEAEALKVEKLELQKQREAIEADERKMLYGKLGVKDEEDAKKFDGKSNEILRELVEYRQHIKVSGGGIPKNVNQPISEEVIKTSDGLQIKQRLRKADGTWVDV